MEEDHELRFVCKLCDKRYPCGKSLGGHMRSHVIANSAESEEKVELDMKNVPSLNAGRNSKKESRVELGGNSGYGLRENPKKTWRAVDSSFPLPQEKVCKQCGKGFQSLKALCGHMACHSEKERVLKDDHSWVSEDQTQVMDSHSDTQAEDLRPQNRSKSKRYNRIVVQSSCFSLANNGSSSVSEIDEQEQEEVAMCLMMLSRDSGNWGGVNSVVESSDNNSVVLETKSSSMDMRIGRKQGLNWMSNGDGSSEKKELGSRKLKSSVLVAEIVQFENSDSGYFMNGAKKVESDTSVDGFPRNGEHKKAKVSAGGRDEESGAEVAKGLNRVKCYETEVRKDLIQENGYDDVGIASKRKRTKDASYNPEFSGESKKILHSSSDYELCKNTHKRSKYECLTCKKTFNSYQALGGHRPCHKKVNACLASRYESGENSIADDIAPNCLPSGKLGESFSKEKPITKDFSCNVKIKSRSKKSKVHECPICLRVFKSGQALGGHKRSHFIGGPEDKSIQTPVIKQELPDLIDLNLPAPIEDEADVNPQFIPW